VALSLLRRIEDCCQTTSGACYETERIGHFRSGAAADGGHFESCPSRVFFCAASLGAAAVEIDQRDALRLEGDLLQRGPNRDDARRKASIEPESAVEWGRLEM
jgi:hypothetical protein